MPLKYVQKLYIHPLYIFLCNITKILLNAFRRSCRDIKEDLQKVWVKAWHNNNS